MKISQLFESQGQPLFLGNFPISIAAMTSGNTSAPRFERYEQAFALIKRSLEVDEVLNTDFDNIIKYRSNEFVGAAFSAVIGPHLWNGAWEKQHPELQHESTPSDARGINSYLRKLSKMSVGAQSTQMWKDAHALATELLPLQTSLEYLKTRIVKASDKKKEKANVEKDKVAKTLKMHTDHSDSQKVFALLKKQATSIEDGIFKKALDYLTSTVETYKKHLKGGESDYRIIFKDQPDDRMTIQSVTQRDTSGASRTASFTLAKNWKEIITTIAKNHASDIVDHFVNKNTSKLAFVLFTKSNLKSSEISSVHTSRNAVEADIHLTFKDGSAFTANSSVVLSFSSLGKPFYRYPTIFRNVVLPDGTKLTNPSEQKMDEFFAKHSTS